MHLGKRRKVHPVQVCVIREVDEHLRSPRVLPRCRERDVADLVALDHRIVLQSLFLPLRCDRWLAMDAELRHEAVDDAEKSYALVEIRFDHFFEAREAQRRPLRMSLHGEGSRLAFLAVKRGNVKLDLEDFRLGHLGHGESENAEEGGLH